MYMADNIEYESPLGQILQNQYKLFIKRPTAIKKKKNKMIILVKNLIKIYKNQSM